MSITDQLTPEIKFQTFGKIPRLFRDIIITEKIDGTNAAVGILPMTDFSHSPDAQPVAPGDGQVYAVYAQSRKRVISPAKDNHGFAMWVWHNSESLVRDLGVGLHFGEWWGSGIQRGYGMEKGQKKFSLFNTKRWLNEAVEFTTPGLDVVPVLNICPFSEEMIKTAVTMLALKGSAAAPGFMRPEGVVVYHTAANIMFKVTVENDEKPKGMTEVDTGPIEIVQPL